MILPCIDLMDGKAVQLIQGKKKALEVEDALGLAYRFRGFTVQLIDLDAAMEKGDNTALLKDICKIVNCRVGGGIRTAEKAVEVINSGAKKIIVGSSVFRNGTINYGFLKELNQQIGKDKIIIAIDSLDGKIVIRGWTESTGLNAESIVKKLEPYCSGFLYTYVDKEGMMQGTDIETLKRLKKATKHEIIAAGGISSLEAIKKLETIGINSALGMALYTGRIKLEDLQIFK